MAEIKKVPKRMQRQFLLHINRDAYGWPKSIAVATCQKCGNRCLAELSFIERHATKQDAPVRQKQFLVSVLCLVCGSTQDGLSLRNTGKVHDPRLNKLGSTYELTKWLDEPTKKYAESLSQVAVGPTFQK